MSQARKPSCTSMPSPKSIHRALHSCKSLVTDAAALPPGDSRLSRSNPGFGDLIPLCCELPLLFGGGRSGALDNLLATRNGSLVLVEAKLAIARAKSGGAAICRRTADRVCSCRFSDELHRTGIRRVRGPSPAFFTSPMREVEIGISSFRNPFRACE